MERERKKTRTPNGKKVNQKSPVHCSQIKKKKKIDEKKLYATSVCSVYNHFNDKTIF